MPNIFCHSCPDYFLFPPLQRNHRNSRLSVYESLTTFSSIGSPSCLLKQYKFSVCTITLCTSTVQWHFAWETTSFCLLWTCNLHLVSVLLALEQTKHLISIFFFPHHAWGSAEFFHIPLVISFPHWTILVCLVPCQLASKPSQFAGCPLWGKGCQKCTLCSGTPPKNIVYSLPWHTGHGQIQRMWKSRQGPGERPPENNTQT